MSAHCCHDDCDCRLTEFWFDAAGAEALAYELGVARPVRIIFRKRRPRRRWQFWRAHSQLDEESAGEALHWSKLPLGPVEHHIITILVSDVQTVLRVLLHEIEHCIQSESYPTLKAWNRAYAKDPDAWEKAAIQAEASWESYGYLIETEEP